jgi:hypothetical protein
MALGRVGTDDCCDNIANHGPQFRENALDLRKHESFISRTNVEEFDAIGYGACGPAS